MANLHSILAVGMLASLPLAPAIAQPVGIIMQAEPLYIPSIGLEVQLPENCVADAGNPESTVRATIRPSEGDWFISIQSLGNPAGEANAAQLTDEIIERLSKRFGVVRTFEDPETNERKEVLVETRVRPVQRIPNLTISGDRNAERAYVSVPQFSGSSERFLGYTVIETTPTEYVVFELSCPVGEIGIARATYETVVATSKFTDANSEIAQRAKRISRGIELLGAIEPAQFDRVIAQNQSRWERLFIPAENGRIEDDTEVGYRHIRCWKGVRGEIDPRRRPENFNAVDREKGYILRMDVRILQNVGPNDIEPVDTTATYFQSLDGTAEAWQITMSRRSGFETATFREIGARHNASLKIHIEGPGTPPTEMRPIFSTEGYISQISAFLLPQLLATSGLPGDYAFYAYRTVDQRVRMREDTLKDAEGLVGVFSLETVFRDEIPAQITLLRDDGTVIRTSMPDGRVWETTTVGQLRNLWQQKDLPLN